jgi:hypothetical protein
LRQRDARTDLCKVYNVRIVSRRVEIENGEVHQDHVCTAPERSSGRHFKNNHATTIIPERGQLKLTLKWMVRILNDSLTLLFGPIRQPSIHRYGKE